jgi:tetratricopeptide (TPR) repeat protein
VLYRSYFWAIGFPGLVFFLAHGAAPRMLLAVGVVVGGLFVWQALDRIFSLETPESAWTDAIEKTPQDPRSVGRWFAYLNRGTAFVERNDLERAMRDFKASAALGDMGMGTFNMGSILAASGRHQEALAAFDRAEKEGFNLYNLPFQRGLALQALGKPAEAYRQFAIAHAMNPPSPTRELLLLHLARTTLQLGRRDEALKIVQELIARDPSHKEGRFLLGMAYVATENHALAHPVFDKLVLEDHNVAAYYGRAVANYGLRRKAEALSDIEAAIRLAPNSPNLREWQAKIKAMP